MKFMFYFLIMFYFTSCKQYPAKVNEPVSSVAVFNSKHYDQLLRQSDSLLMSYTNSTTIENAYKSYSDTLKFLIADPSLRCQNTLLTNKYLKTVVEKSVNTPNSQGLGIWEPMYTRESDSADFLLAYRSPSRYLQFLETLGMRDPLVANYLETYRASGQIPPTLAYGFVISVAELNLKDDQLRLMWVVHCITVEWNLNYWTRWNRFKNGDSRE